MGKKDGWFIAAERRPKSGDAPEIEEIQKQANHSAREYRPATPHARDDSGNDQPIDEGQHEMYEPDSD
jgi:hypothetical protein